MVRLLASVLTLAALATAGVAAAQPAAAPTPEEKARRLFDDAVAGRCDDACACYEESLKLVESVAAHMNLAHCLEQRGKLASARDHWKGAIAMLPPDDERAATAKQRLAALDARMPRMTFQFVQPPVVGTRILVDGHDLGPNALTGANVLADPGRHRISVETPGQGARTFELDLQEGSKKKLVIEPPAPAAAPTAPAPAAPLPVVSVPVDRRGSAGGEALEVVGSITLALGGGALVGALITGVIIAENDVEIDDACDGYACTDEGLATIDESERLMTANSILWGTAGIGLLAGGALLIAGEAVRPGVGMTVVPTPGGATFVVAGRLP